MAHRHPGQERRCSHRHRGHRPRNSLPMAAWRRSQRGWRIVTQARSAGRSHRHRGHRPRNSHRHARCMAQEPTRWPSSPRPGAPVLGQTGIAAAGRETPIAMPAAWRRSQRGWRIVTQARSAGLHPCEISPLHGAGANEDGASSPRPGAPVFRPASRPQAAKLPSAMPAAWRRSQRGRLSLDPGGPRRQGGAVLGAGLPRPGAPTRVFTRPGQTGIAARPRNSHRHARRRMAQEPTRNWRIVTRWRPGAWQGGRFRSSGSAVAVSAGVQAPASRPGAGRETPIGSGMPAAWRRSQRGRRSWTFGASGAPAGGETRPAPPERRSSKQEVPAWHRGCGAGRGSGQRETRSPPCPLRWREEPFRMGGPVGTQARERRSSDRHRGRRLTESRRPSGRCQTELGPADLAREAQPDRRAPVLAYHPVHSHRVGRDPRPARSAPCRQDAHPPAQRPRSRGRWASSPTIRRRRPRRSARPGFPSRPRNVAGIAAAGRETPIAMPAAWRRSQRGWRIVTQARSAGLQTGIAAAGRETPIAMPAAWRRSQRGWRIVTQTRSAGLQTGIAAAGRETPSATPYMAQEPTRLAHRHPGQERRSSHRHRGHRPRNSLRHARCMAQEPTRMAHRHPGQERWAVLPVGPFRPASRPQAAKLPSPCSLHGAGANEDGASSPRPGAPVFRPASRPQAAKLPSPCPLHGAGANEDGASSPRPGAPVFTPASRPQAAKLPSPCPLHGAGSNDDGASSPRPGAPVFRPASRPRPRNSHRHARCMAQEPTRMAHRHPGQERRSSDRHRGQGRETPSAMPAAWRRSQRGWRIVTQARSAGLQTGIAAAGRETPIAMPAAWRRSQRGWRIVTQARSAGVHTGIAAAGRETPSAMLAAWRRSQRGWRIVTQARSAGVHTGIAAKGREIPSPCPLHGAGANEDGASSPRPGAPVFRPASRPQAAKLPSPPAAWRRSQRGWRIVTQARSAGVHTGIAAAGRETPSAMLAAWRRSQRGWRIVTQARSAGVHTGIAAKGREIPSPCPLHGAGANEDGASSPRPGAPVFRPASRPQAAKLPSPCSLHGAGANEDGASSPRPGAPVFTPASRPRAAKLPPPCSLIARTQPGTAEHSPAKGRRRRAIPVGCRVMRKNNG